MDYIKELEDLKNKQENLINQAKQEGYEFINGTLIKDKYVPVIEFYARAETEYEASGHYYMVKKIIPITQEILTQIKKLELTQTILINDFIYDILDNIKDKDLEYFYDILDVGNQLEEEDINYIIEKDDLDNRYYLNDKQKLYLEFFFNKDNLNGYISVFDMKAEDLANQKTINVYFIKYLTNN